MGCTPINSKSKKIKNNQAIDKSLIFSSDIDTLQRLSSKDKLASYQQDVSIIFFLILYFQQRSSKLIRIYSYKIKTGETFPTFLNLEKI